MVALNTFLRLGSLDRRREETIMSRRATPWYGKSRLAGAYNLQIHPLLGKMPHSRRSFATKYCEEYPCWIPWQAKMSGQTAREKVAALKSMVPARGKTVLVKDIAKREFPVELRA